MKLLFSCSLVVLLVSISGAARADWFWCQPRSVDEYSNHVRVVCHNSITLNGNVVSNVALSYSNTGRTNRFISLATSALSASRVFLVNIPTTTSTNVAGCSTDCRTPTVFGIQ